MVGGRRTPENPFEWAPSGGLIDDERSKQLEDATQQETRLSPRRIALAENLHGAIFEVGTALRQHMSRRVQMLLAFMINTPDRLR